MKKMKVCFVTGTRADYGILNPVMSAVKRSGKLNLQIVATGMHLMKEFGYTVNEIARDGFKIDAKVDIGYGEDSSRAVALSVGEAVFGLGEVFAKIKPDLVMVLGDRGEMLAAAVAANYLSIPVAHLHGGEVSGHVDGIIRHAITKLSHLHFPATREAAQRICRMGEERWRINTCGAPALDRVLTEKLPSKEDLIYKYRINDRLPLILLAQHPVITEQDQAGEQIETTIKAILGLKGQLLIIYPNADAGGRQMIRVIKEYQGKENVSAYRSVPHKDYLGLLSIAAALVGNSSSGLIEAPSFRLPVVNIGTRQIGRQRSANVLDTAYDQKAIRAALKKALYDRAFRRRIVRIKNPYGDGHTSERIIKTLESIKIDQRLLQKQITY